MRRAGSRVAARVDRVDLRQQAGREELLLACPKTCKLHPLHLVARAPVLERATIFPIGVVIRQASLIHAHDLVPDGVMVRVEILEDRQQPRLCDRHPELLDEFALSASAARSPSSIVPPSGRQPLIVPSSARTAISS